MSEVSVNRGGASPESTPRRMLRAGVIVASALGIAHNSGNAAAELLPEITENTVTISINGTWNGHSKDPLATGNVPLPKTEQQLYVDHPGEPAIIGDMAGTLEVGKENYTNTLNSLSPDTKVIRIDYSEGSTIAPDVDPAQVIARYSIANPYDKEGGILRQYPILNTVIGIDGPEVVPDVRPDRVGIDAEICRPGDPICDNAGLTGNIVVDTVRIADNLAGHSGKYGNRHGTYWDPALRPIDEYIDSDGRRQVTVAKPGDEVAPLVQELNGHLGTVGMQLPQEVTTAIESMVDHGTPGSTPGVHFQEPTPRLDASFANNPPAPTQLDVSPIAGFMDPTTVQETVGSINQGLAGFGISVSLPR